VRAAFRVASEFVILCEHEKVTFREYFLGENLISKSNPCLSSITALSFFKRDWTQIQLYVVYVDTHKEEIHSICKNVVLFQTTQTDDGYRYECDTR
jgi:hypothetical protein